MLLAVGACDPPPLDPERPVRTPSPREFETLPVRELSRSVGIDLDPDALGRSRRDLDGMRELHRVMAGQRGESVIRALKAGGTPDGSGDPRFVWRQKENGEMERVPIHGPSAADLEEFDAALTEVRRQAIHVMEGK